MTEQTPQPSYGSSPTPIVAGEEQLAQPSLSVPFQFALPGMVPIQQHVQQVQVWQGQFPPPEAIERYAQVQPDSFDRIIRMAELQQSEAIALNRLAIQMQSNDVRRGHYLGAGITASAIIAAILVAMHGMNAVAIALVSVPVMAVAKSLIDSVTAKKGAAEPVQADGKDGQLESPKDTKIGSGQPQPPS